MARITVEDCIDAIPDRFELVLLAAERARALGRGAPSDLTPDRDKRPVIALREIASGSVAPEDLRHDYIAKFRQIDEDDLPDKVSDQFEPESIVVPDQDTSWQDNGFESRYEDMEASEIQDEDASRQDNGFQSTFQDMEKMPDETERHERDIG
jgi:DNA-directed RNA polymerase subunit omega